NAACAAALACCSQGKDAGKLDDAERDRLRRQALNWLRDDLELRRRLPEKGQVTARTAAPITTIWQHWLVDADLAGVRGPEALAKLPVAERQAWQKLWEEVTVLRDRSLARDARLPEQESARIADGRQAIERNPKDAGAY